MEEFKFNSESSFSQKGERNGTTPITIAFKKEAAETVTKKNSKKSGVRILSAFLCIVLIISVSFASGAFGAYVVSERLMQSEEENAPTLSTNTEAKPSSFFVPGATSSSTYATVAANTKPCVVEITT